MNGVTLAGRSSRLHDDKIVGEEKYVIEGVTKVVRQPTKICTKAARFSSLNAPGASFSLNLRLRYKCPKGRQVTIRSVEFPVLTVSLGTASGIVRRPAVAKLLRPPTGSGCRHLLVCAGRWSDCDEFTTAPLQNKCATACERLARPFGNDCCNQQPRHRRHNEQKGSLRHVALKRFTPAS